MKTPAERVQAIFEEAIGSDLTSWEKFEFLPSIKGRSSLTDKQEKVLQGIEKKVLGETNE